jgi:hypothetical protein
MRMRRAQDEETQLSRRIDVVGEPALAGQERFVFDAADRFAAAEASGGGSIRGHEKCPIVRE